MKRLALAAALLAAPAYAQQVNIQAGPNGFSVIANDGSQVVGGPGVVTATGPAGTVTTTTTTTTTATSTAGGENYKFEYEGNPERATVLRVLSPEGAQLQVWDGKKLILEDDIPAAFDAQPDKFYRFVVKYQGMLWEKKFAAKRRHTGSLWVYPPAPAPVVVATAPAPQPQVVVTTAPAPQPQTQVIIHEVRHVPAPAPVPMGPMPMSDPDFARLKAAIDHEDFGSEKLRVLQTAAPSAYFTISQVGQLVDLYDFGAEKLKAVEMCAPHILDRQNAYQLYSHFDFDSEKEQVRRILGQ